MASKRKPLTFPELDNMQPKGKGAILRSPEEVAAEEKRLTEAEVEELSFDTESPTPSTIPQVQKSGNAEMQNPAIPQMQNSTDVESRKPAKTQLSKAALRASYAKASYRMHPDAFDAIADAKRVLSRQYNLKASLEEIAEKAVLIAFNDLMERGEESDLVKALREEV